MKVADLTCFNMCTFCLRYPREYRGGLSLVQCKALLSAPRMQQLSVSAKPNAGEHFVQVFLLPVAAVPAAQFNLVYLGFPDGLTHADLTYLLTAAAPPVFAAQLTHLALKLHYQENKTAAAALLPVGAFTVPVAHTRACGRAGYAEGWWLTGRGNRECAEWDAAVQALRAVVGSAWCERVTDVVACREDAAWRRNIGLPAQN